MKKLLLLSAFLTGALGVFAQGTVNFANGAAGVNAPITNATVSPSVLASGPAFQVQLYVGPAGATSASQLSTNGVAGAPAPLATGASSGYFFGGARDITGFTPGSAATLQVRAWTGGASSWETATQRGESNLIPISLGGGTIPTPNMVGLQGFAVTGGVVPEPSSIALGLLGLGAIVLFRRRK